MRIHNGQSMDKHGLYMDNSDNPWIPMDYPWRIMDYPWIIQRDPWIIYGLPMDIHGYPWTSMDIYEYPRISMNYPWIIHGYPWIIHGYPLTIRGIHLRNHARGGGWGGGGWGGGAVKYMSLTIDCWRRSVGSGRHKDGLIVCFMMVWKAANLLHNITIKKHCYMIVFVCLKNQMENT